jgi:opacity protein-like surface antigen
MKGKLTLAALALGLWGGAALADEVQVTTEQDRGTSALAPDQRDAVTVSVDDDDARAKAEAEEADMRGLTVMLGAGIEGYTGALRPQIDAGLGWGVTAAIKPSKVLGLEFGYSGAANELGNDAFLADSSEGARGADLVRNGGQVVATLGLTASPVQPYLLGGVGLSRYTVRAPSSTLNSDWAGSVPLGGGLRTHVGNFTADARLAYNLLWSNDFAPSANENRIPLVDTFANGNYTGLISLGSTF